MDTAEQKDRNDRNVHFNKWLKCRRKCCDEIYSSSRNHRINHICQSVSAIQFDIQVFHGNFLNILKL
jgi:hypothetical protein